MMISAVGVVRLFPFLDLCVEFPFPFSFSFIQIYFSLFFQLYMVFNIASRKLKKKKEMITIQDP